MEVNKRMKVQIEIPSEFVEHFNMDRFKDSLQRLMADSHCLSGRYDKELAEMLIGAFGQAKIPRNKDLVKEPAEAKDKFNLNDEIEAQKAISNVKAKQYAEWLTELRSLREFRRIIETLLQE